jgi:basic membrane protein A
MNSENLSRRNAIRALGAVGIGSIAGCSSSSSDSSGVRAAFVYNHEASGLGYTQAHDTGRQTVNDEFDWLETVYTESVSGGDASRVITEYARGDTDIVFATNFAFMDPMYNVASDFPETKFEHCSGFRSRDNMGRYFGRLYQARYLTGIAAGQLTESNTLGYVASIPIPEVIRQLNAFFLGAKSVNPDVTMKVRWLNTFMDPPTATEATNALVDEGADVINNHMSTAAPVTAAANNDAWSFTYTTSMSESGGNRYGGSAVFNWAEYYRPALQSINEGNWEADNYWEGLESGVVSAELGDAVPDSVVEEVASAEESIKSGEINVWADTEFKGKDDSFLFESMASYVDGIEGEVPNS